MGREKVFKVSAKQCSGNDLSSEAPLGLFSMMEEAGTVLPLDLRKAVCEATELLEPDGSLDAHALCSY